MKRAVVAGAALMIAGMAVWWIAAKSGEADSIPLRQLAESDDSRIADRSSEVRHPSILGCEENSVSSIRAEGSGDGADGDAEPQTEEEKREAEEERLVDAFDDLTDKWQEPSEKGVTMADIDNFAKVFRMVPKARQDECIHRALNLVPDENVMLLAGVLMDKAMDKEIVEEVYNDILNRDDDVKKPILQEIFKDKAHPCWADTAWILDATGDLPQK